MRAWILVVSIVWLAGCTVGPDYEVETFPELDDQTFEAAERSRKTSPATSPAEGASADDAPPLPDSAWWRALGDDTLVELVDAAAAENLDLEVAATRLRRADAARRSASAGRRPSVGGGLSAQSMRASELTPEGALAQAGLTDLETERYRIGPSAAWEIDIFGGMRRSTQAADARLDAAQWGRHGVMLAVISEVVRTYTALRGAQRRLALAEQNLDLQQKTQRRLDDLHRVGLGSRLDVERSTALLEATRSRLPPLRSEIYAASHRLAVLTGRLPTDLLERLLDSDVEDSGRRSGQTSSLMIRPGLVPVGLPSDLLKRRPDIRMAERRLAAATAEIGVATANRFPRFFLTGSGGLESSSFSDLFKSAGRTWSLGPSISWPIFQGGRLRAGVDAAEAVRDEAVAHYQHSVLRAVEDVETALVSYAEEELRRQALAASASASVEALNLAQVVYDQGLESYFTVLDAERSLVEAEDRLAASETGVTLRLVALYAALGGGWESTSSQSTAPAPAETGVTPPPADALAR